MPPKESMGTWIDMTHQQSTKYSMRIFHEIYHIFLSAVWYSCKCVETLGCLHMTVEPFYFTSPWLFVQTLMHDDNNEIGKALRYWAVDAVNPPSTGDSAHKVCPCRDVPFQTVSPNFYVGINWRIFKRQFYNFETISKLRNIFFQISQTWMICCHSVRNRRRGTFCRGIFFVYLFIYLFIHLFI